MNEHSISSIENMRKYLDKEKIALLIDYIARYQFQISLNLPRQINYRLSNTVEVNIISDFVFISVKGMMTFTIKQSDVTLPN